jgi:hypothetical protein
MSRKVVTFQQSLSLALSSQHYGVDGSLTSQSKLIMDDIGDMIQKCRLQRRFGLCHNIHAQEFDNY